MFGRIIFISESVAHLENTLKNNETMDLMNIHVIFEAPNQRILGEISEINPDIIKIRFLGEFIDNHYVNGVIRKPLLSSKIRIINEGELKELIGSKTPKSFELGHSAIYKSYTVYPSVNAFFSNHFFICGNSGAGKTHGISRIIQNVFSDPNIVNENAKLFIFDAYGEYKNALRSISNYNPKYQYKFITSNIQEPLTFTQPLITISPSATLRGSDSPVSAVVFRLDEPSMTIPSKGTRSPGLITMISPICTSAGSTSVTVPARSTFA